MFSSVTKLDELPVELWHRIFKYLSTPDLILNLRRVNHRLRSVTLSYPHYELDLRFDQIEDLCLHLQPEEISSLCLSSHARSQPSKLRRYEHDDRRRLGCVELFLTLYADRLDRFTVVRSLDLTELVDQSFTFVLDRLLQSIPQFFQTLQTIKNDRMYSSPPSIESFLRLLRSVKCLRHLSLYTSDILQTLSLVLPTVERLHLKECHISDLATLIKLFPNVQFFTSEKIIVDENNQFTSPSTYSLSIHGHRLIFTGVTLTNDLTRRIFCDGCASFLETLTNVCLQYRASNEKCWTALFDGFWWERSLKRFIPQLKSFEWKFECDSRDQHKAMTRERMNEILHSFRTEFWLVEKRWLVYFVCSPVKGTRLFTQQFLTEADQWTTIDSSFKSSTDPSRLLDSIRTTTLRIDLSQGQPSLSTARFGSQVVAFSRTRLSQRNWRFEIEGNLVRIFIQ